MPLAPSPEAHVPSDFDVMADCTNSEAMFVGTAK